MGTVAIETVRAAPAQEKAKRQRLGQEFANVKYQRQLSSTRSSTRYVYHTPSERRERVIVSVVTLLRKMLSFSNGCLQFVQNMSAVCILNLIVNFRLSYTANITFKI